MGAGPRTVMVRDTLVLVFTLAAWLHDLDPVAFDIGFPVRWYGLSYIAGFVLSGLLLWRLARSQFTPLRPDRVADLIFAVMVGVLVGGRLGYVFFYQPSLLWTLSSDPPWWGALAINDGGMASHGGMIGVIVASILFARSQKISALHVIDLTAFVAPIGLFLGRGANFINGELLGRIVARPGEPAPWWSVKFPQELLTGHRPELSLAQQRELDGLVSRFVNPGDDWGAAVRRLISAVQHGVENTQRDLAPLLAARHPSQLYQATAEGLVLFAALALVWARPRKPGVIGACFLMIYGALRIVTEFWRLPDDHLAVQRIAGLTRGQLLSALMILAGAATLAIALRRAQAPRLGGWLSGRGAQKPGPAETGPGE